MPRGATDGVVLRRGNAGVPFGKPFKYTDASDLSGEFTPMGRVERWLRKCKRRPVAYAVVEPEYGQAHMVPVNGEIKIAPFNMTGSIEPVYDENIVFVADEYERENPQS